MTRVVNLDCCKFSIKRIKAGRYERGEADPVVDAFCTRLRSPL
jgi:hypothetical protein